MKSDILSVNFKTNKYFPYEDYKANQKQIEQTILHSNNQPVCIEAGTGIGKSVVSLSSLLTIRAQQSGRSGPIFVFVKTLNQIEAFFREWKRIAAHTQQQQGRIPLIMPYLGRTRLCPGKHKVGKHTLLACIDHQKLSFPSLNRKILKLQRKNRQFRLLKLLNFRFLAVDSSNLSAFIQELSNYENCPYYSLYSCVGDADIIVTTYAFLQPRMLNSLLKQGRTTITTSYFLLDEAHNLLFEQRVEIVRADLMILNEVYQRVLGNSIIPELQLFLDLMNKIAVLPRNELTMFRKLCKLHIRAIEKILSFLKLPETHPLSEQFRRCSVFFRQLIYPEHYELIRTPNKLSLITLYPDILTQPLLKAKLLVLQSATMNPPDVFSKLLGLPESTRRVSLIPTDIREILQDKNELRLYLEGSISSESGFRNPILYQRYVEYILQLFTRSPGHLLVFCPSYEFINQLSEILKINPNTDQIDDKQENIFQVLSQESNEQINERLQQLRVLNKALLQEVQPMNVIKETQAVAAADLNKQILGSEHKAIILANQQGKLFEGNEWVDTSGRSIISMVVMAGLFTHVPREEDEVVEIYRSKKLGSRELARLTRDIQIVTRIKQAMGRARRHKQDRLILVILDYRVSNYVKRQLVLQRVLGFKSLLTQVDSFLSR
jgi:Rad3-related DNA helicase